jgi:hypothetical protein
MPNKEKVPLNEKLTKTESIFSDGIAEAINTVLQPPKGLEVNKRGVFACLSLGTVAIAILAWLKAEWYGYAAETIVIVSGAILIRFQRKRNGYD